MVSDALSWEQAEEKKAQITALLKQWQRDEKLPYRLSMSIGYYQKEPDTEASMEQYINWADERMYEMKCKNREQQKINNKYKKHERHWSRKISCSDAFLTVAMHL